AGFELTAMQALRLLHDAHLRADRAVVAQELLDSRRRERRVTAQLRELPGKSQQRRESVRDVMRRRLMAREKQQHAGRDELVRRKPVAVLLQAHELAQQIGTRRPSALGDER